MRKTTDNRDQRLLRAARAKVRCLQEQVKRLTQTNEYLSRRLDLSDADRSKMEATLMELARRSGGDE